MADILASLLQGYQGGVQMRQDSERRTLADLLGKARGATGGERDALMSQAYPLGPDTAMQAEQSFGQLDDAKRQRLGQTASVFTRMTPEMRAQAWPTVRQQVSQILPGEYPEQWDESLLPVAEGLAQQFGGGGQSNVQSRFVNERGEVMALLRNGQVIATGERADPQRWLRDHPGMNPEVVDEYGATAPVGAGGISGLVPAVIQQESGGNPNAVSPRGARGLMQVMPGTGADPGFGVAPLRDASPQENVRLGTDYLQAMMQRYGDQSLALAAYNAGPGRVDQALQAAGGDPQRALAMLPQETQQYVPRVLSRARPSEAQVAAEQEAAKRTVGLQFAPAEAAAAAQREGMVTTARDTASAQVERNVDQRGKATALQVFNAGMDELERAMDETVTGPLLGRVPAFTADQQTADGTVAAMAPVLKQLFRSAGEGVFTDRDQALLIEMLPTRADHPEARKAKAANVRRMVEAKLQQTQESPAVIRYDAQGNRIK